MDLDEAERYARVEKEGPHPAQQALGLLVDELDRLRRESLAEVPGAVGAVGNTVLLAEVDRLTAQRDAALALATEWEKEASADYSRQKLTGNEIWETVGEQSACRAHAAELREALGPTMPDPTASAPWTVTLAWTPDQNFGAVSALNGRVALHAIFGLLYAGESHESVAAEYGLSGEEVAVLDQLRHETCEMREPQAPTPSGTPGAHFRASPRSAGSRADPTPRVPVDLGTLIGWVELALESSAIEVDVWETDPAGTRAAKAVEPLRRLTRCLRSAGLLDETDDGESPILDDKDTPNV